MSEYILGLDVGSSEVKAVIAKNENDDFSLIGIGKFQTSGVKKGKITNIEQASYSIKEAVRNAVEHAGVKYDKVIVSISGTYTDSVKSQGVINIENDEINIGDIKRAMQNAEKDADIKSDCVKLHVLPYNFKVDAQDNVEDPLGMCGSRLEVTTHIITAPRSSILNLQKAVQMCGIKIDNIVLSGYASAISTLTKDEKESGVALIDMGGSTCDMIIHLGNSLRYNSVLPVGSSHITNDISSAIHTPLAKAEEIKIKYDELKNNTQEIEVPIIGDTKNTRKVSLEIIARVIFARLEETIVCLGNNIKDSRCLEALSGGIVLTGGMVKLGDIRDLVVARFPNLSVRVAKPRNFYSGLSEISQDEANSCVIGLCMYAAGKFTPYEIDSNSQLRYKDINIKKPVEIAEDNLEEIKLDNSDIKIDNLEKSNSSFQKCMNWLKNLF